MTGQELCDSVVAIIRAKCEAGNVPLTLRLASVIGCEARCREELRAGKAVSIADYVTLETFLEESAS